METIGSYKEEGTLLCAAKQVTADSHQRGPGLQVSFVTLLDLRPHRRYVDVAEVTEAITCVLQQPYTGHPGVPSHSQNHVHRHQSNFSQKEASACVQSWSPPISAQHVISPFCHSESQQRSLYRMIMWEEPTAWDLSEVKVTGIVDSSR